MIRHLIIPNSLFLGCTPLSKNKFLAFGLKKDLNLTNSLYFRIRIHKI